MISAFSAVVLLTADLKPESTPLFVKKKSNKKSQRNLIHSAKGYQRSRAISQGI